jgi:hypothetical protein
MYLDKESFTKLLAETFDAGVKLQEHYVALIASKPETSLADIKQEVGKLQGMGILTQMLEEAFAKLDGEDI